MAQELINIAPEISSSAALFFNAQQLKKQHESVCNSSNKCTTNIFSTKLNEKRSVKKQWSLEEDIELMELVCQYGDNAWHRICKAIPNKTEIKCFKRWKYL